MENSLSFSIAVKMTPEELVAVIALLPKRDDQVIGGLTPNAAKLDSIEAVAERVKRAELSHLDGFSEIVEILTRYK